MEFLKMLGLFLTLIGVLSWAFNMANAKNVKDGIIAMVCCAGFIMLALYLAFRVIFV